MLNRNGLSNVNISRNETMKAFLSIVISGSRLRR